MTKTIEELIEHYENEAERIARKAAPPMGIEPDLAAAAANCFLIAAGLRFKLEESKTSD